jgi:hypothetical protein
MRAISIFAGSVLLIMALCWTTAFAGANFNGGYSGFFEWENPHSSLATGSAFNLGVTYRPDKIVAPEQIRGISSYKIMPENFEFFLNGAVRDGQSDVGMLGMGYSILNLQSIEFLIEGAAVEKQVGDGRYALGAYAGMKIPFKSLGQSFCFTFGGGYCSNPIMVVGLNFLSE